MARVLVVEDDADLAEGIEQRLTFEHYTVEVTGNGADALEMLKIYQYDLVVLDWNLPELTGVDICRRFRAQGGVTPILMLTGEADIAHKEAGLDSGADDYLTKPFEHRELLARVRALLRRPREFQGEKLTAGGIVMDLETRSVTKDGKEIHLKPLEFMLLEFFMRNPNRVFSQEALLERVWPPGTDASNENVRTYIKTLRKQIDRPQGESLIRTIYGAGYKFEIPS